MCSGPDICIYSQVKESYLVAFKIIDFVNGVPFSLKLGSQTLV